MALEDGQDDRLILVIGRLERALSRIEQSSANVQATSTSAADEKRHMQLKNELMEAIKTVDALIAEREAV